MNWININVTTIDSEEFLGSNPIERATWLCLMRYCCGQENGGRIAQAKEWKDRKWQQVVRVTLKEVMQKSDLWSWDGDDLIVWNYSVEKEEEVQHLRSIGKQTSEAKRAAAKANGAKGGRPTKNPTETQQETHAKPIELEVERKGSRKEGEEEEVQRPLPPKFDEILAFARSAPMPVTEECAGKFFDEMEATQWTYRNLPCVARTAWHARFRLFITNWNQNEQGRGGR